MKRKICLCLLLLFTIACSGSSPDDVPADEDRDSTLHAGQTGSRRFKPDATGKEASGSQTPDSLVPDIEVSNDAGVDLSDPAKPAVDESAGDASEVPSDGGLDTLAHDTTPHDAVPPDHARPDDVRIPDIHTEDATISDSTPGDTPTGDAFYDLSGFAVPFAFSWPQSPRISRRVAVANDAELRAALAIPNVRIEVAPGRYGPLVLTQDDQHVVADDRAVFSGLTTSGRPRRVIVEGGVVEAGTAAVNLVVDDFVIRNVNIASVRTFSLGVGSSMAHRVAVLHNTIYASRVALFSPGATAGEGRGSDFVIAANYLQGGMTVGNSGVEPALRIQSHDRAIIVDNRARCGFEGQGTKHTYRSHYGNNNYFMRHNMNEYGDGIFFSSRTRPIGDHWVYDHVSYYNGPMGGDSANAYRPDVSPSTWPGRLVAVNNVAYRAVQTDPGGQINTRWIWNMQAGDVVQDNIELPYRRPPALSAWRGADGRPPGADH